MREVGVRGRVMSVAVGVATALATLAPPAGANGGGPAVMTDAAGDANGVNGQYSLSLDPNGPDSRPASIDGADLRRIEFSTTYTTQKVLNPDGSIREVRYVADGLKVQATMEGDVLPTFGPSLMLEIPANVLRPSGSTCPALFRAWWRGPEPLDEDLEQADIRPCGFLTDTSEGFDLAIDGPTVTMHYPFSAPRMPGYIEDGTEIKPPYVQTAESNFPHVGPQWAPVPTEPVVGGNSRPTFIGHIDETALFPGFVVGSDVPPDVDCAATPDHPDCSINQPPGPGPHVQDVCGDADVMARVSGTKVRTPDPERAAGYDIEAAWFEDLYEEGGDHAGVRVHLRTCGDVPEPEIMGSAWSVRWGLEGPCSRLVSVRDGDALEPDLVERVAYLESQCSAPGPVPGSSQGYVEWSETLGASSYSIQGDHITWTLTADMLPSDRAERVAFVAPGTVWSVPSAYARDGRQLTMFEQWEPVHIYASGPGAWDPTPSGRDFTVGEPK